MQPIATFVPPPDLEPTRKFPMPVDTRAKVVIHQAKTCALREGVELGTGDGRTAATVLSKCLWLKLSTVDRWEPQPDNIGPETWAHWPHRAYEMAARNRLAVFGRRVRVIKAWTVEAADRFDAASLDFVIFDADKGEYGLRADIMAWSGKVKPGGQLIGFDAHWPSVQRVINELCPGHWIGPDNVWGIIV